VIAVAVAAAAAFFGCLGVIAVQASRAVCRQVTPADDGPAPVKVFTPALVGAAAVLGGLLVARGALPLQVAIGAIVVFALVACWYSDAISGIVPDLFTLPPLAALLLFSFAKHDWEIAISALIVFVPFAAAALFTRGYGMGWGDAKLVALVGAALGAPLAFAALTGACAAAFIGHRVAGAPRRPIAFAPYIAAATAIALPLGLVR